jgi:hypothetical protein
MQKDTLYGVLDGKSIGSCSDRAIGVKTDLLFDGVFGSYVNSTLTILRRGSGLFRRILSFRIQHVRYDRATGVDYMLSSQLVN